MLKIDSVKLADLIEVFLRETGGACISTGACIGIIDGKRINLRVSTDDDEDSTPLRPKFECVTEERWTPGKR